MVEAVVGSMSVVSGFNPVAVAPGGCMDVTAVRVEFGTSYN